jgi:uncharacterized phage protein gp47/JayE
MALPQLNQPFVPSTQEQLRDAMLADYRYEMIRTTGKDPAVTPGTEIWVWATMNAGIAMLQFSNIELSRDAITPNNATGQDLENWRLSLGLPEVNPAPSSGRIVVSVPGGGTGTLVNGQPVQLPNGLRAQVVSNWVGISDGAEVDVVAIDTGTATNFDGGTPVTLVAPPGVFATAAAVSKEIPLTGGTDAENDDRKRSRILNAIANKPSGGNWGHIREMALDALASVQDCYVYPALGGPASVKVVPVRDFDPAQKSFTRALSSGALNIVRTAIYNQMADGVEVVVEAPSDQLVDVALLLTLPSSSLSGGNGNGWLDQVVWPPLIGGETRVTVTTVTSTTEIVISAGTAVSPVAGQTHIMWWSPIDRQFRTYLIIQIAAATPGAWDIVLDRPLVSDDGTPVASGDFISPAAVNADGYGTSWVNSLRVVGPGENTSDANRIPRALRHPYVADEDPSALTFLMLRAVQDNHPEISDIAWSYRSSTAPLVPASVATPVNILVPSQFGIYPQ